MRGRWLGIGPFALLIAFWACSGSRGERVGSECLTNSECDDGTSCESGTCVESLSASASVTGKVAGAPSTVRIEQRGEAEQVCEQKKAGLVCRVEPSASLVLFAPEVEGHRFVEWTGPTACKSKKPELKLKKVEKNLECTANYVRRLSVSGEIENGEELSVRAFTQSEFAECEESRCVVDRGQSVVLLAPERDGYRIAGFEGEGCEEQDGYSVTVTPQDADVTCIALYVESLTVRGQLQGIAPELLASGDVAVRAISAAPESLCQGQLCGVDPGQSVTLIAPLVPGYRFAGWTGDESCASSEPEIEVLDVRNNVLCTADYVRRVKVQAVSEGADAELTVSADAGFPDCFNEACEVDEGTTVTLLAGTVAGYRLRDWSGEGCTAGSGSSAIVREPWEDRTCVANFVEGVAVSGTVLNAEAEVEARSSSDGAECEGGRCVITPGGAVTLTAPSLPGRAFRGWSGDRGCTGTALTITLSDVTESKDCRATFAPRYRASGRALPLAGGRVEASATAGNPRCSGAGCEVDEGATVQLTATAEPNYRFTGWTGGGACTGSAARLQLTRLASNVTCSANFIARIEVAGEVAPSGAATIRATTRTAAAVCSDAACVVDAGSNVTLTATAADGWRFVRWTGCGNAALTDSLLLVNPTSSMRCVANYERITYVMTADSSAGGSAEVQTRNCVGASCRAEHGSSATFTARPNAGYQFVAWSGGCSGPSAMVTVANVRSNVRCTAGFERIPLNARSQVSLVGAGATTARSSTSGSRCSGDSCTVPYGGSVSFEASENTGYRFTGWSGCGQVSGRTITLSNLTDHVTCNATFEVITYRVRGVANAGGTVTCADGCTVQHGRTTTLTASPNIGYFFARWSGVGCPASPYAITVGPVTADTTCTASFERYTYQVVGVASPAGGGSVSCANGCPVKHGDAQSLTATPATGYRFVEWLPTGGCPASTSPTISLSPVVNSTTCTASFARVTYRVTGAVATGGGGSVSCANGCTVSHGDPQALTATPATGYRFVDWSGTGCPASTSPSITIGAVTANTTCTARFAVITYPVYGVASPGVGGSVSCAGGCSVAHGGSTTLTAVSNPGYRFLRWNCPGPQSPSITVANVTAATTCTATFVRQYTVTVTGTPPEWGFATCGPAANGAGTCVVDEGSSIQVRAVPIYDTGSYLEEWTGNCTFEGDTTNLLTVPSVRSDLNCTAHFDVPFFQ